MLPSRKLDMSEKPEETIVSGAGRGWGREVQDEVGRGQTQRDYKPPLGDF